MFAVLYEFRVKENQHTAFVDGWRGLTELVNLTPHVAARLGMHFRIFITSRTGM